MRIGARVRLGVGFLMPRLGVGVEIKASVHLSGLHLRNPNPDLHRDSEGCREYTSKECTKAIPRVRVRVRVRFRFAMLQWCSRLRGLGLGLGLGLVSATSIPGHV